MRLGLLSVLDSMSFISALSAIYSSRDTTRSWLWWLTGPWGGSMVQVPLDKPCRFCKVRLWILLQDLKHSESFPSTLSVRDGCVHHENCCYWKSSEIPIFFQFSKWFTIWLEILAIYQIAAWSEPQNPKICGDLESLIPNPRVEGLCIAVQPWHASYLATRLSKL